MHRHLLAVGSFVGVAILGCGSGKSTGTGGATSSQGPTTASVGSGAGAASSAASTGPTSSSTAASGPSSSSTSASSSSAASSSGAGGSGGAGGSTGAGGSCGANQKNCVGCVSVDDPNYGCGTTGCIGCAVPNTVSATCVSNACAVGTCVANYADCNGVASDGCEADLTSAESCGGCNTVCPPSAPFCVPFGPGYACAPSCAFNQNLCGVTCTDITTDPKNCGMCGNACPVPAGGTATCANEVCGTMCPNGGNVCGGGCVASPWTVTASLNQLDVESMWGASPTQVWGVGYHGIKRYDGTKWSTVAGTETWGLSVLWGSGASDVWAGGAGAFAHYDGTSWTQPAGAPTTGVESLFGTGPNDVWAGGSPDFGTLSHWNGTAWTPVMVQGQSLGLGGISGSSPSNLWAVAGTSLYHYDGTAWTLWAAYSGNQTLRSTWTFAANDAWAFGAQGTALHFDGIGWTTATSPFSNYVSVINGNATTFYVTEFGGDLWHYTGGTWTDEGIPATAFWQASPTVRLAAALVSGFSTGDAGVLYRDTGSGWSGLTNTPVGADLTAIWVVSANDAWIGSRNGDLLHWDGTAWTRPATVPFGVASFWGSASNDLWAVGSNMLAHWNGATWTPQSYAGFTTFGQAFTAVWGFASNDVWAVGNAPDVLHYDGTAWTKYPYTFAAQAFTGLWGAATHDLWAFTDGTPWHYDGTGFIAGTTFANPSNAWGFSSTDIWSNDFEHWDGTIWNPPASTVVGGAAVWGAGTSDVWIVGSDGNFPEHGTSAHWDGTAWCLRDAPITEDVVGFTSVNFTTEHIVAVGGSSSNDVWAVGKQGLILHHP